MSWNSEMEHRANQLGFAIEDAYNGAKVDRTGLSDYECELIDLAEAIDEAARRAPQKRPSRVR